MLYLKMWGIENGKQKEIVVEHGFANDEKLDGFVENYVANNPGFTVCSVNVQEHPWNIPGGATVAGVKKASKKDLKAQTKEDTAKEQKKADPKAEKKAAQKSKEQPKEEKQESGISADMKKKIELIVKAAKKFNVKVEQKGVWLWFGKVRPGVESDLMATLAVHGIVLHWACDKKCYCWHDEALPRTWGKNGPKTAEEITAAYGSVRVA